MSNIDYTLKKIAKMNQTTNNHFSGVTWGTVKTINPLTINVDNVVITESIIELSPFCQERKTKVFKHNHYYDDKNDGQGSSGSRTNVETEEALIEIIDWRGLQVGDKVCMLRTNESQRYIVLWRQNMFKED